MPYFNPSLEEPDPFTAIASGLLAEVEAAEQRLLGIEDRRAAQPRAAGKWSRKQILGHLIDSAANNHQRFIRAQETGALHLPAYAQEHWVSAQRYDRRPWKDLITLWSAYNRHLAHVIANIAQEKSDLPCTIGGNEPVTLDFIARDYVGHLRHHLKQIFELPGGDDGGQ